jgi:hypothetical protein
MNNLPYIIIDKVKYAHPNFLLVDIYRVYCDPMTSYWRLNKSFTRSIKLYKYYPLIVDTNYTKIKFRILAPENVLSIIRKKIIQKSNLIAVGAYAYNYYMSKINKTECIKINYYELITDNIIKDATKIYKILIKNFKNNITVKEYYPFIEIFDKRIEFYYNNILILKLYNNNSRCIVYNNSEKKKTKFGTVQLTLLYLISIYNYFVINKNIESDNYFNMYINLIKARDDYLNKNNITVLDKSPFKDFSFNCIGQPISLDRKNRIESIDKKNQGKLIKFRYDPKEIKGKAPDFKFSNTSGNQIINEKYFIIK